MTRDNSNAAENFHQLIRPDTRAHRDLHKAFLPRPFSENSL